MTRPVGAGEVATGGVDAADFDPQRRAITQKQPFADRAVHRVVGEAVRRRLLEIEAGVPTEEVEQVACVSEIEAQARAAERQRRRCGPRAGAQVLVTDVELGADDFGEEVAQSCAAADAALEAEHLVVVRERAESAELELMSALRAGGADGGRERQSQDRERAHETVPSPKAWPYGNKSGSA